MFCALRNTVINPWYQQTFKFLVAIISITGLMEKENERYGVGIVICFSLQRLKSDDISVTHSHSSMKNQNMNHAKILMT